MILDICDGKMIGKTCYEVQPEGPKQYCSNGTEELVKELTIKDKLLLQGK